MSRKKQKFLPFCNPWKKIQILRKTKKKRDKFKKILKNVLKRRKTVFAVHVNLWYNHIIT